MQPFFRQQEPISEEGDYSFFLTYGFRRDSFKETPKRTSFLSQKVSCVQSQSEIYLIGSAENKESSLFLNWEYPAGNIYLLRWENRLIPFLVHLSDTIVEKEYERREHGYVAARCRVPVKSVLVTRVGCDLKISRHNWSPRNSWYFENCFFDQDSHGYAFSDQQEYLEALKLIEAGLPLLLADRYEPDSYAPVLPAEIVFSAGPWNLVEDDVDTRQKENLRHYGSPYRQAEYIVHKMLWAKNKLEAVEQEISDFSSVSKLLPSKNTSLEFVGAKRLEFHNLAREAAEKLIEKCQNEVESISNFFQFIEISFAPKHSLDSAKNIDDLKRLMLKIGFDEEIQSIFFVLLENSNHQLLKDFESYRTDLQLRALQAAEKYEKHFRFCKEHGEPLRTSHKKIIESFLQTQDITLETLMADLIRMEPPLHDHSYFIGFRISHLCEDAFVQAVKAIHERDLKKFFVDPERLLISITEIMVTRRDQQRGKHKKDRDDMRSL